ncbi:formimidoylglutamate deiminase [Cupriavidus plantarum]|uniref:Formimidoylglutamate deiminase n=1 Tax=Cupriavidus plantarum TaxID=942865 RepID=A0A316EVP3_9BURK|nr:formimidoylglutamate deiminase [Cupriavidus plantarum]PWK36401.1 formimidoylglutamate deiminase [Cupriavidus plantarum]REF02846.1 formimidoylglutamate deiminase [Cupriavidus plantarum]CAG2142344.1 5'-deoxyadenosine deaminase [Cupriavidus plantarum]SMR65491.1 formimidoylglutamate deiminase [Cupriavidus plantarum]
MSVASQLFARQALLPGGWARDVLLGWDASGRLTAVTPEATPEDGIARAAGPVVPGMPNLHSHAFQRGFAGLTEMRSASDGDDPAGGDSFWSWRTLMYRFALRLSPDTLEAIATQLYVEMLRAGYTSVCEFHYVHHDTDGKPYADGAEMSLRLLRAARRAGIGMTLLPVLYQTAGFGGKPAQQDQRRFLHRTEAMLSLLQRLAPECAAHGARLGLAPHSLRAVPPDSLRDAVAGLHAMDPGAPVHIHIAEQQREVDDCLAQTGTRPVAWLLDHAEVDARWCLVHATHMDWDERRRLAESGAVAGICPTTEANLGDGVFEAAPYLARQGAWGIGSDSHASVSVAEELRTFEYGQRLGLQRRNVLASDAHPQVADRLWLEAVAGGARAAGRPVAGLAVGNQADFAVLDGASVALAGLDGPRALAVHVFASHGHETLAEVRTAGVCRVQHGRHPLEAEAGPLFTAARARLLAD